MSWRLDKGEGAAAYFRDGPYVTGPGTTVKVPSREGATEGRRKIVGTGLAIWALTGFTLG